MFDRKKYKDFAKIQLKNRLTVPMLVTLIILLIGRLLSIPDSVNRFGGLTPNELKELMASGYSGLMNYFSKNQQNDVLVFLFSLIQTIVNFVLGYGAISVYLKMSRSPENVPFSTFIDGLSNWTRAILTGLWQLLWVFIWGLLFLPVTIVVVWIATLFFTSLPMVTVQILIVSLSMLGFIPAIIKSISYSQMFYIACECPDVSIKNTMKISKKITNGHKMDIFITTLSFIGWFALGILSLGILNLWIQPYYKMTMTNVYHGLLKEALENGIISPKDLNPNGAEVVENTDENQPVENTNRIEQIEENDDSANAASTEISETVETETSEQENSTNE